MFKSKVKKIINVVVKVIFALGKLIKTIKKMFTVFFVQLLL